MFDYAQGDKYRGEFKASRKHGNGIYVWANGDRYSSENDDDNSSSNCNTTSTVFSNNGINNTTTEAAANNTKSNVVPAAHFCFCFHRPSFQLYFFGRWFSITLTPNAAVTDVGARRRAHRTITRTKPEQYVGWSRCAQSAYTQNVSQEYLSWEHFGLVFAPFLHDTHACLQPQTVSYPDNRGDKTKRKQMETPAKKRARERMYEKALRGFLPHARGLTRFSVLQYSLPVMARAPSS